MSKGYKRAIRATLHRRKGNSTTAVFSRFFANVTSALSRGVALAIEGGQPGDVLELTSSNFDYLIATLALKVGSKGLSTMDIKFHFDGAFETERKRVKDHQIEKAVFAISKKKK